MKVDKILTDIRQFFKDRSENPFSEKNTTPFAGAFLISFFVYNWELFYSITHFIQESLEVQIKYIKGYISTEGIKMLAFPALFSILSIIVFYVLNNISLAITTTFNRWVKPVILNIIDKHKVVDKESFNLSEQRFFKVSKELEELKEKHKKQEDEKSDLYNKNIKLSQENTKNTLEYDALSEEIADLKHEHIKFKNNTISEEKLKSIYCYDNFQTIHRWKIIGIPPDEQNHKIVKTENGFTRIIETSKLTDHTSTITISNTFTSNLALHKKSQNQSILFQLRLQVRSYSKIYHDNNDPKKRSGKMSIRIGIKPIREDNPQMYEIFYSNNGKFVQVSSMEETEELWDKVTFSGNKGLTQFDNVEIVIEIKSGAQVGDEIQLKDIILFTSEESR